MFRNLKKTIIHIERDIVIFWNRLNGLGRFLSLTVIFLFTFGALLAGDLALTQTPDIDVLGYSQGVIVVNDTSVSPTPIPTSTPRPLKANPINGLLMELSEYQQLKKLHPVAVVVNNHADARPQYGLTQADAVLEVLAEGGITRYVALFYQNQTVEKIGPVRSLRYYMIEFASEYADAVILHHGWAGFDNADFEIYREKTDARGAVARYGIKSLQTEASAYRDLAIASTHGYVHSLFTDSARINSELARIKAQAIWSLGAQPEALKFKDDLPPKKRGDMKKITINFTNLNYGAYTAVFEYNKKTNSYDRSVGGTADIDALNGQRVSPKNVIVEWHNYQDANDGHSRIIIDMIGQGKVEIFRDGKGYNGLWKKDCRTCRTRYYDNLGKEIKLNRGQIWIVNAIKTQEKLVSSVDFE